MKTVDLNSDLGESFVAQRVYDVAERIKLEDVYSLHGDTVSYRKGKRLRIRGVAGLYP
jgi:hypothetical protein